MVLLVAFLLPRKEHLIQLALQCHESRLALHPLPPLPMPTGPFTKPQSELLQMKAFSSPWFSLMKCCAASLLSCQALLGGVQTCCLKPNIPLGSGLPWALAICRSYLTWVLSNQFWLLAYIFHSYFFIHETNPTCFIFRGKVRWAILQHDIHWSFQVQMMSWRKWSKIKIQVNSRLS